MGLWQFPRELWEEFVFEAAEWLDVVDMSLLCCWETK